MPTVEITVRDQSGNPDIRKVRLHRRDTGEVVGEALSNGLSGLCRINTGFHGEAYAVVLDDAAGVIENDQIVRIWV